jgi:hypothetical protein
MRLASVLDLKAELRQGPALPRELARALHVRNMTARGRARTAATFDALHARSIEASTIALGVAPGRGRHDFVLGVRIQVGGRAAWRLAEQLRLRTRGESDIRIAPRITKREARPASWFRRRRRPVESGLSVGHHDVTAGSIGFIVEDVHDYYVLSNNHVLANVNAGQPGDPVVQPGPADRSASMRTLIGVLDRYVPISFQRANLVDGAVAALLPDVEFYAGWTEALPGVVRGVLPLGHDDLNLRVRKAGRTTGVTEGRITQIDVDRLRVDLADEGQPPRVALFSDQFEVQGLAGRPFSGPGDSGSLIVDRRGRARGLVFAGGRDEDGIDLTFANRIEYVLQKLGVSLAL